MAVTIERARLRTRRAWILVAPIFVIVSQMGFIAVPSVLAHWLGPVLASVAAVSVSFAHVWRRWFLQQSGLLRADDGGVTLDGKRIAPREALMHGYVVREGERMFLRLVRRGVLPRSIDIEVSDLAQANELVAALRLGAGHAVAEHIMADGHRRNDRLKTALLVGNTAFLGLLALGALLLLSHLHVRAHVQTVFEASFGGAFSISLLTILGMTLARDVFIAVGGDGVWIRHRFVSKRFVSFAEIRDVKDEGGNITLTLTDNTTVDFHHSGAERAAEGASLVERIRAGIEAHRTAPPRAAHLVGRNGRTILEWIRGARDHHPRSATYRTAIVPEDQLWRIVEDAAAPAIERAGAALALRTDLNDDGRARLRVTAGACAEQKLRVALESVATTENDEELATRLEPLEDRRVMALDRVRS